MSITFTWSTPGTYDGETSTWSGGGETTVTGSAIRVRGNPETYRNLGLIEADAPTLLFIPTTYGELPEPGYTVTWANVEYTVKDVSMIGPDGVAIGAKIVIAR